MSDQISTDRLIRDIEEGVIIVDNTGTISNINPKAREILEIQEDYTDKKYIAMIDGDKKQNDTFHQMLVDAVTDKKTVHKKRIGYVTDSARKTLYIASSVIRDEEGGHSGIIISFDDVTTEEKLKYRISTSALMFIVLVAMLSVWMFVCAIYIGDDTPINQSLFGRFIMYLPLLFTPVATKVLGFTADDLGLGTKGIKKYVAIDAGLTVAAVALMCALKLLLLKLLPSFTFYAPDGVFFDLTKYTILERVEYGICVIAQEYLTRGLVYECIRRIITTENNEKYADVIAIFVSSLYFAALHIYLGVQYMIGAFVLLSFFGFIYKKQRSIWGLCIPHFVLGVMVDVLGFTAT